MRLLSRQISMMDNKKRTKPFVLLANEAAALQGVVGYMELRHSTCSIYHAKRIKIQHEKSILTQQQPKDPPENLRASYQRGDWRTKPDVKGMGLREHG